MVSTMSATWFAAPTRARPWMSPMEPVQRLMMKKPWSGASLSLYDYRGTSNVLVAPLAKRTLIL